MNETDLFEKKLLPIVLLLAKDRVSNVRLNSAIILKNVKSNNKDVMRDVNNMIEELRKDIDLDIINALE